MSQDTVIVLTERKPGVWQCRVEFPTERGQKRRMQYSTFKGTEREAEAHRRELIRQHADIPEGFAPAAKQTVAQAVRANIENRVASGHVAPGSAALQLAVAGRYIDPAPIGGIALDKLTTRDVEQFMRGLASQTAWAKETKLAPGTRRQVYGMLFQTCKAAVRGKAIKHNVVGLTDPPKLKGGKPRALPMEDLQRILAACPDYMGPVVEVAIRTGMRRAELCGLAWGDVDLNLDAGVLHVRRNIRRVNNRLVVVPTKTAASERSIPLSAELADLFRSLLPAAREGAVALGVRLADLPVFPAAGGGWMAPDPLTMRFKRIAGLVGLPAVRLHDLRHSFVTHSLRQTRDWHLVSARAGHANVKTTMALYGHLLADDAKKIVDPFGAAAPAEPPTITPLRRAI
jgi:integrase